MQNHNPYVGSVPLEGPKALATTVEILPPTSTEIDLRTRFNTATFMGIQAIYYDGSQLSSDVLLQTSIGQTIILRKKTQGYITILEGIAMKLKFTSVSYTTLPIILLNQPIATTIWDTAGNVVEVPIASVNTLGGIKVGENLTIESDGTLNATGGNVDLPIATPSRLGGIKVGANLTITADGTLNATGGGGGGGGSNVDVADFASLFLDREEADINTATYCDMTYSDSKVNITISGKGAYVIDLETGMPDDHVGNLISSLPFSSPYGFTHFEMPIVIKEGGEYSTSSVFRFINEANGEFNAVIELPDDINYISLRIVKVA